MADLSLGLKNSLKNAKAFIFDMDGTLALGRDAAIDYQALPGAVQLLELLHKKEIPFCVFTNGTANAPAGYAENLRKAGLPVKDSQMITPATTAAIWFKKKGIQHVRVLGNDGARQPLEEVGIKTYQPEEESDSIQAIFTASSSSLKFMDLKQACNDIQKGALLTTSSHVPFFASRSGKAMSVGFAINQALMGLTGCALEVLGKPSANSLFSALEVMGLPQADAANTIVVGDDPALEIALANNAGAVGVLVATGIYQGSDVYSPGSEHASINVLPNVSHLIRGLG